MKYNIKSTDIALTPAIREYAEKKLNNLDRFVTPENAEKLMCYVELGKSTNHHKKGEIFKAEFTVHIGSKVFRAQDEEADLYAAIDIATASLAEELRTFKNKEKNLIRRTGTKIKNFVKSLYGADR